MDFYDPNAGTTTIPGGLSTFIPTVIQWPSGQDGQTYVPANNVRNATGYTACSLFTLSDSFPIGFPTNTYISGYPDTDYFFDSCWGNHFAKSNIIGNIDVTPFPGSSNPFGIVPGAGDQTCFPLQGFCLIDICSAPSTCVPVPYCPTLVNLTWSPNFDIRSAVFVSGAIAGFDIGTGNCDGVNTTPFFTAPYTSCFPVISGHTNVFYLLPDVYCTGVNQRCGLQGGAGAISQWPYPANVPIFFFSAQPAFLDTDFPTWNSTMYLPDCKNVPLTLCANNSVNVGAPSQGVGGYVDPNYQTCPGGCCANQIVPGKFPQGPITVTGNVSGHFVLTGLNQWVSASFTFTNTINYTFSTEPPSFPNNCAFPGDVSYNVVIQGTSPVTVPVEVFANNPGGGAVFNGIGHIQLSFIGAGLANNVGAFSISGPSCPSFAASFILGWYADLNQIAGSGTVACFDSTNHFTGFCDGGICCGDDGVHTFYSAEIPSFGASFDGHGLIDCCSDTISITLTATNGNGFLSG
jgi:hypothetical protein